MLAELILCASCKQKCGIFLLNVRTGAFTEENVRLMQNGQNVKDSDERLIEKLLFKHRVEYKVNIR